MIEKSFPFSHDGARVWVVRAILFFNIFHFVDGRLVGCLVGVWACTAEKA